MYYSIDVDNKKFQYEKKSAFSLSVHSTIYKAIYENVEGKKETVALKVIKDISKVLSQVKKQISFLDRIAQDAILKNYFVKTLGHKIRNEIDVNNKAIATLYLVMEHYEQGNLQQFLEEKKKLSEEIALQLIVQVIYALNEVQKLDIVLKSIKLSNLFVQDDKNNISLKIDFFGFQHLNYDIKQQKCDKGEIWQIGLLYYQMLYGRLPWESLSMHTFSSKKGLTFPQNINTITSKLSQDFITKCMENDNQFLWPDLCQHKLIQRKMKKLELQKNANKPLISTLKINLKESDNEGNQESLNEADDVNAKVKGKLDVNTHERNQTIVSDDEKKNRQLSEENDRSIQKESIHSYDYAESQFKKIYTAVAIIQSFCYESQSKTLEFMENIGKTCLHMLSYAIIKKLDSLLAKSEQFYTHISSQYHHQDTSIMNPSFSLIESLQAMQRRTKEDLQEFNEKIKDDVCSNRESILMLCAKAKSVLEQTLPGLKTMQTLNKILILIEEIIEENNVLSNCEKNANDASIVS